MNTRNIVILTAALLSVILIVRYASSVRQKTRPVLAPTEVSAIPVPPAASTEPMREQWANLSRSERLRHLERLGHLPEYADQSDWSLAASTTWWGRRLNAKDFWSTNIVWLDSNAVYQAQIHGREFPPIPDEWQEQWKEFSDRDVVSSEVGIDSFVIRTRYTERERAFWDNFAKVMPMPPYVIDEYVKRVAINLMDATSSKIRRPVLQLHIIETPQEYAAGILRRDAGLGFPPELYDAGALRLAYIASMHDEYKRLSQELNDTEKMADWLKNLYVEPDAVVNGLNQEQRIAMKLWKVSYLRRLSDSDRFKMYVPAYLKAWNITASEVSAPPR